ncbi:phosphotransferase enzyme family protein [Frondihabitans sucicola]|uniref:phosphotransferase enzyme family protein n=1 Tax=Frondihabitans sucicola TaxID=1268041 RepID=UPI003305E808
MSESRTVRVEGDVVFRPRKPWTSTVHSLLRHLYDQGLPVPEPLGIDADTECVRLVPGDGGEAAWPHQVSLDAVASAGELLRRNHDATRSWRRPEDAVWAVPAEGQDVICHGDPQPGNMAWHDGIAVGLFDWDDARPAERMSDVAYALEWFTPFDVDPDSLRRRGLPEDVDRPSRIHAFLDGYGWTEPLDVVDEVLRRQQRAIDEVVWLGKAGHEPQATWVAEGWPARWASKLDVTESLRREWRE